MSQWGWHRFVLAAPIMLAVIIGSQAARAQAVDQAMIDELRQTIAEQQRQIDQQQRQLDQLSSELESMQQQVESVQQSAGQPTTAESIFREVQRQTARGQEEARISGTPPNRLGRIIVHRAGKNR